MIKYVTATFLVVIVLNTTLGQAMAQDWTVSNEKIFLQPFLSQPKDGDIGHYIEDAVLVQDWLCIVVEQSRVKWSEAPFVWRFPRTGMRRSHVLAFHLSTKKWRCLTLPDDLFSSDVLFRIASLSPGEIRIGLTYDSTNKSQFATWRPSDNKLIVSDVSKTTSIDGINRFFEIPDQPGKTKSVEADAVDWSLVTEWRSDDRVGNDRLYLHYDTEQKALICLRKLLGQFEFRKFESMSHFPGEVLLTQKDLEKKYGKEIVSLTAPMRPPIRSQMPFVCVLKNGNLVCDQIGSSAQDSLPLPVDSSRDSEVTGLVVSASGSFLAVSVYQKEKDSYALGDEKLFVLKRDQEKKAGNFEVVNTLDVGTLPVVAISDSGELVFSNGNSILSQGCDVDSEFVYPESMKETEVIGGKKTGHPTDAK